MKTVKHPQVDLVWSTPNPRWVVAVAARMTRSARDVTDLAMNITDEETTSSIRAILEARHFSVLRHVSYCFTVQGVSRALSHQLVRHTAGHAYEQRSQHYRVESDPSYIMPGSAAALSIAGADETGQEIGNPGEQAVMDLYQGAEAGYNFLLSAGMPREDARMVLPTGIETQLIWTANLEAILNFVQARACRVNTSEIIEVAVQVRRIVLATFPEMVRSLGPTCWTRGVCYEGRKFFTTCKARPWASPTVLWSPQFPAVIDLVSVGDRVTTRIHANASGPVRSDDEAYSVQPKGKEV